MYVLTPPQRDVLALSLHDYGGHRHSNRHGIKVRRVWSEGDDGRLGGQRTLTFDPNPVEATCKPHGPHEAAQDDVHHPEETQRRTKTISVRVCVSCDLPVDNMDGEDLVLDAHKGLAVLCVCV